MIPNTIETETPRYVPIFLDTVSLPNSLKFEGEHAVSEFFTNPFDYHYAHIPIKEMNADKLRAVYKELGKRVSEADLRNCENAMEFVVFIDGYADKGNLQSGYTALREFCSQHNENRITLCMLMDMDMTGSEIQDKLSHIVSMTHSDVSTYLLGYNTFRSISIQLSTFLRMLYYHSKKEVHLLPITADISFRTHFCTFHEIRYLPQLLQEYTENKEKIDALLADKEKESEDRTFFSAIKQTIYEKCKHAIADSLINYRIMEYPIPKALYKRKENRGNLHRIFAEQLADNLVRFEMLEWNRIFYEKIRESDVFARAEEWKTGLEQDRYSLFYEKFTLSQIASLEKEIPEKEIPSEENTLSKIKDQYIPMIMEVSTGSRYQERLAKAIADVKNNQRSRPYSFEYFSQQFSAWYHQWVRSVNIPDKTEQLKKKRIWYINQKSRIGNYDNFKSFTRSVYATAQQERILTYHDCKYETTTKSFLWVSPNTKERDAISDKYDVIFSNAPELENGGCICTVVYALKKEPRKVDVATDTERNTIQ